MPKGMLVSNGGKYAGKYVTTKSFKDKKVLSAGTDPVKVVREAREMGVPDPVLIYVLEKGMSHIY